MRIAHIIGSLGVGGAERNLVNLLNAMHCEYRAAIMLDAPSGGASFSGTLDHSIERHYLNFRRRNMPIGLVKLALLLKRTRVNVVHTHMYYASLYGVLAARMANVPVVLTTEHGENPRKSRMQRWLERTLITPLSDLRLCVSPRILILRRDVDRIPESKLALTFNGTVIPPYREKRVANPVPVIGAVGRFIPAKDYPKLLQAVSQLRDSGYVFRLQILGDGPDKETVVSCIQRLGLEKFVEMPGMVANVDQYYRQFDIYVISSLREGQPVALLEAMAHGLPIVATDCGNISSTVGHNDGGIIVPSGDPTALASALAKLLDNPTLREMYGRNARKRAEQEYSVDALAAEHARLYEGLFARKGLV